MKGAMIAHRTWYLNKACQSVAVARWLGHYE